MFAVYDNGGKTFDRYTILIDRVTTWRPEDDFDAGVEVDQYNITTSGNPSGFWQHGEGTNTDGDQRIDVSELPEAAQKALLQEMQEEFVVGIKWADNTTTIKTPNGIVTKPTIN